MKIGLFDPYLDTLGGGERYILSIASALQDKHEVILFWDDESIVKKATEKFLLKLDRIKLQKSIFTSDTSTIERLKKTYGMDYFFYISDGSIPLVASKHVVPIVQFPIDNLVAKTFLSRLKLVNTSLILCYSEFVKKFLDNMYPPPVRVLWPPVPQIESVTSKKNVILSVGRFTKGNNTKNQEMLINFFKAHKSYFKNWKLVLAGSFLPEDEDFIQHLKKLAEDSSIEIHTNLNFAQLSRFYSESRIYWHATGFGKDVNKNPHAAEHFGISVVEAMSVGTVPIVFNGGGLREIVDDGENGFLWNSETELFDKTQLLISDNLKYEAMSKEAIQRSKKFSVDEFNRRVEEIIL